MNIKKIDKNIFIAFFVILIVVLIGISIIIYAKMTPIKRESSAIKKKINYQKVDKSVIVNITADSFKREMTLTIDNIPEGTEFIEYDIQYIPETGLLRAVIGKIVVSGQKSITKKGITIGTCSQGGRCVYEKGVNSVHAILTFLGSYGEKIFEKKFQL